MSLKKVGATTLATVLLGLGFIAPAAAQEQTTPVEQVRVIVKADLVGGGTLVDQTVDRDDAKTILQTIEQAKGSVGMKKATSWGSDYIVGLAHILVLMFKNHMQVISWKKNIPVHPDG